MKTKWLAAVAAVAIAACSRAPVTQVLRHNGHTVLVTNSGSHDVVVIPWKGAAPVKVAKGATVSLPRTGGPSRWDLTISASGKTIYQGIFEPGAPQTLTVDDRAARVRGHESGDKDRRPAAVKP